MQIQIDMDGEITICTLQEFAQANADDMPDSIENIVSDINENGEFVCGGGAAPIVRITAS